MSGISLSGLEQGILQFDEFMIHKCPDIAGYFLFEKDKKKQTEYVKNSYKHEKYTEFHVGVERVGYRADENGLTLWNGNYLSRTAEATIPWNEVRDRIAQYMENDTYLKPGQVPQWTETENSYQQLSLFPSLEEQLGNIAVAEASIKYTMPAAFSLPQEQLDTILRSGGGRDNSRKRIYAKYQQGKTPEEMAEFLKNEYKTTGKGFGDNPVSLWFDENGMQVGYGTSAKEAPLAVMSWQEVESHIRSMVENGTYMSANEVFLVESVERERVANDIQNFFRDGIGEMPENLKLKAYNYPESISQLCSLLFTKEGREQIVGEIEKAKAGLDSGEKQIKWNYVKTPEYLLEQMADLSAEKKEYPANDTVEVRQEDFITQDEIDARLTGGSGFEYGKFRIYDYFRENHTKKENIEFLKKEYGTGGSSHALPGSDVAHEDHDAKGISLEKGSYGNPYAKVLLKWNVVEKRISELIKANRYLSPKSKEAYKQYKQEQAEKAMQREQVMLYHFS